MEKCDLFATGSGYRGLVNQTGSGRSGSGKLPGDAVAGEGEVVYTLAPRLDEFTDRTIGIGALEKLQMRLTDLEKGGTHLLLGDIFDVFTRNPEYGLICFDGSVKIPDGNTQVINSLNHKLCYYSDCLPML